MSVTHNIDLDLITALKAHEAETASILRMLKSALKNAEIASGKELSEAEAFAVLEKQAKQRRDAAEQYNKGGRPELAEKELAEVKTINKYLPEKMSEAELVNLVETKISELGATNVSEMGKVIGAVMAAAKGTADGASISKIVKEKLS